MSEQTATHRCKVCGAHWHFNKAGPDPSWSLVSPECGACCNNVAMGDQIEPIERRVADRRRSPDDVKTVEIDLTVDELHARIAVLAEMNAQLRTEAADMRRVERRQFMAAVLSGHAYSGRTITNPLIVDALHIADEAIDALDADADSESSL